MSTRMYDIYHPNTARCNHILDTNLQCQSPALRGKSFCYWHEQNRKRDKFTVPLLETEQAIQATLSQVLRELHEGKIDTKRANSMFYGLSLAMYNVRRISHSTDGDHVIDLPPAMLDFVGADVPVCPPESAHEAWKSGASAPRSEISGAGALAPVEGSAPSAPSRPPRGTEEPSAPPKLPPQPDHQMTRSSDHPMPPETARFLKRVLRAGPSHPKFAEVSRLYDRYISTKQAG